MEIGFPLSDVMLFTCRRLRKREIRELNGSLHMVGDDFTPRARPLFSLKCLLLPCPTGPLTINTVLLYCRSLFSRTKSGISESEQARQTRPPIRSELQGSPSPLGMWLA